MTKDESYRINPWHPFSQRTVEAKANEIYLNEKPPVSPCSCGDPELGHSPNCAYILSLDTIWDDCMDRAWEALEEELEAKAEERSLAWADEGEESANAQWLHRYDP